MSKQIFLELVCQDKSIQEVEFRNYLDWAFKAECNSLSVLPFLLVTCDWYLKESDVRPRLGALIDYPLGCSLPAVRLHEIIACSKHCISYVDVTLNHAIIGDGYFHILKKEIQSCLKVCNDYDVECRLMFDYRVISKENLIGLSSLLFDLGINEAIISTGFGADDTMDNAIVCNWFCENTNIRPITSGRIYNLQHVNILKEAGAIGCRLHDWKIFSRIWTKMVYKEIGKSG